MQAYVNLMALAKIHNPQDFSEIWTPIDPTSNLAADLPIGIVKMVESPRDLFGSAPVVNNMRRWTVTQPVPNSEQAQYLEEIHKASLYRNRDIDRTNYEEHERVSRQITELQAKADLTMLEGEYTHGFDMPSIDNVTILDEFEEFKDISKTLLNPKELYCKLSAPVIHVGTFLKMNEMELKSLFKETMEIKEKTGTQTIKFLGKCDLSFLKKMKWRGVEQGYTERYIPRHGLRITITRSEIDLNPDKYQEALQSIRNRRINEIRYRQRSSIKNILSIGYSYYRIDQTLNYRCRKLLLEYLTEIVNSKLPKISHSEGIPVYDITIKARSSRKVAFEYASLYQKGKIKTLPSPADVISSDGIKGTLYENIMQLVKLLKLEDRECNDMIGHQRFSLNGDWSVLEDPYLYILQNIIKEHPLSCIRLAELIFATSVRRKIAEENPLSKGSIPQKEPIETWIRYGELVKDKDAIKEVLALKPLATRAKLKFVRKNARISRRKTST